MAEYTLTPTQSEQCRTTAAFNTDPEPGTTDSIHAAIERGACPWCDDYTGEFVGQHASSAHPDEWRRHSDGED